MSALVSLVDLLFTFYTLLIMARVLLSWVRVNPYHPVVEWIYRLTEPLLAPIRNMMPPSGMIDWSPMIAMFVVMILRQLTLMVLTF